MLRILLIVVAIIAVEAEHDEKISKRTFPFDPYVMVPEPVAFWPLNMLYQCEDVIGGNDAMKGNVELVNQKESKGRPCGAYKFFGTPNSWIMYPNDGAFNVKDSITIMAWICPSGNAGPIFHYDKDGNGTQMWLWDSDQSPGSLYGRVRFNKVGITEVPQEKHMPGPPWDEWHHCAVTYDGTNNFGAMYLDGVFLSLGVLNNGMLDTAAEAQSGAVPNGVERYFNGLLTCVQVYDVALTQAQVKKAAHDERCICPNFRCDPHVTTLDGRQYSYQGMCWYTLVRDCSSSTPEFEITADLIAREDTEEVRTRAVAINVTVGGESVLVDKDNVATKSGDNLEKINIMHEDDMVTLSFKLKDTTFKIFWAGRKHTFNVEFTGDYYRGKMCGLLGDGDGNPKNDFKKPDGVVVKDAVEFGDSWKVSGKTC